MKKEKTLRPTTPLNVRMRQHWQLYLLLFPAILYLIIFNYAPLYGLIIAFKDYKPYLGYWDSPFTGFSNFIRFLTRINLERFFLILLFFHFIHCWPVFLSYYFGIVFKLYSGLKLKKFVGI